MSQAIPTVVASSQTKKEVKSLVELCAVIVAWNYNEGTTALPCEVVECLQKHMKSWRQKKYFHEYKEWYPSGQVAWYERYNDEGAKEGECKQWYEDGRPKLLCHYKGGLLDGEWKQWYENGSLWNHRYYKDGELHGEAKSWNEKGPSSRATATTTKASATASTAPEEELSAHVPFLLHVAPPPPKHGSIILEWPTSGCVVVVVDLLGTERGTAFASIGGETADSTS